MKTIILNETDGKLFGTVIGADKFSMALRNGEITYVIQTDDAARFARICKLSARTTRDAEVRATWNRIAAQF